MPTHYWPKFFWTGTAAFILSCLSIVYFDRSLAVLSQSLFTDTFLFHWCIAIDAWTSSKQIIYPAMAIGLIGTWYSLKNQPDLARPYQMVFLSYALAYLLAFIVKFVMGRYRPELMFNQDLYGFGWFHIAKAYTSFPSGHAVVNFTLAFSLAAILWERYNKVAWVFVAYGVLIALTRLIVNQHYLGDVLASLAIACWSIAYVMWLMRPSTLKQVPLEPALAPDEPE